MDDEDCYEIEESTLMVELQGIIEADFLNNVKQAKILGIDSERPLLQLDDYTFAGEFMDTLGSCMLFQDVSENLEDGDGRQVPETKLKYFGLTNKKLCSQRIFLKDKEDKSSMMEVPVTEPGTSGQTQVPPTNKDQGSGDVEPSKTAAKGKT